VRDEVEIRCSRLGQSRRTGTTFWKQAAQPGLKPKIAFGRPRRCCSRARSRPWETSARHVHRGVVDAAAPVQVLADRGERRRPGRRLHQGDQEKQWTQPLGFTHALFEVAVDVLKRAASLTTRARSRRIKATNLNTVVGPISWARGPCPMSPRPRWSAGSWVRGKDFRFDMVVVSNKAASSVRSPGSSGPSARRERCGR